VGHVRLPFKLCSCRGEICGDRRPYGYTLGEHSDCCVFCAYRVV
jgi:hypothetical protein